MQTEKSSLNKFLWVVIFLLIVCFGVALFFLLPKTPKNSDKYSAVFLTNGQVYFGNITEINKRDIVLKHIYYIQTSGVNQGEKSINEENTALVKLGNELHGPTDEMKINRDHILFTEVLRDDSKVVQAIKSAL